MKLNSLILGLLLFSACQSSQSDFVLIADDQQASVYLAKTTTGPVRLAVKDLVSDVEKISGKSLEIVSQPKEDGAQLMIFNLADEAQAEQKPLALNPSLDTLSGQWEAYVVQNQEINDQQHLLIVGSDERATIFGIYHFIEEYLGVNPMYYWSDYRAGATRSASLGRSAHRTERTYL